MPETAARLRHLKTSPTKIRPVLKLIAGKDVANARDTLRLCDREVSRPVAKLLASAVANAEHNDHVPEDELFVLRAFADEGPTQKRWRPRARGRGVRINKRTSHITIIVARFEEEDLEKRRRSGNTGPARPRPRPTRRPQAEDHDHDHDEHDHDDHDHEHAEEGGTAEKAAPVKKAKKTAKKAAKTTKKAAKTTKKAEASTATKKVTKATKKPAKKKDDD